MKRLGEAAALVTIVGAIAGSVIWQESRYANAAEMGAKHLAQAVNIEQRFNEDRLERLVRELDSIYRRRFAGYEFPGDAEWIADLNDEIRIAREYRTELREQAALITGP
jgi:hypothetical protein